MTKKQTKLNNMNFRKSLSKEELEELERKEEVYRIFKLLKSKGSDYFHCRILERLHFYLDMPMVREALMKIYRTTKSEPIKRTIIGLHDGSLDMSSYYEAMEEADELDAYAQEIDREYEMELQAEEMAESVPHLNMLKQSFKQI